MNNATGCRKIAFFIMPLFLFSSCEKDIFLDFEFGPKLVMTSFVCPQDTIIIVRLTQSAPIGGKNALPTEHFLSDAIVEISEGDFKRTLSYDSNYKQFVIDAKLFPILEDHTYKLSGKSVDGRQVHASCTVPLNNNTLVVELEKTGDVSGHAEYLATIGWSSSKEDDFGFRIFGEIRYSWTNDFMNVNNAHFPIVLEQPGTYKDNLFRTGRAEYRKLMGFADQPGEYVEKVCQIYLLNVDEHYFKYHESLDNSVTDDPFAVPAFTYSNVEGGLGVFGAYNVTIVNKNF